MVRLSSVSLRLLLPNCLQAFWGPAIEQKIDENLEQTTPNAVNHYTLIEPAVYEPGNTKPASSLRRPPPVYSPKPTQKGEASKISSIEDCHTDISQTDSVQSDGNMDSQIIMLPHIPPHLRLVKGRIIDVRAGYTDFSTPQSHGGKKIALEDGAEY